MLVREATTICLTSDDAEKAVEGILFATKVAQQGQKVSLYFALGGLTFLDHHHMLVDEDRTNVTKLVSIARDEGVSLYACSMYMAEWDIKPENVLDGVQIVGVTSYLANAEQATVNLHW